jgi:hypothetical protein
MLWMEGNIMGRFLEGASNVLTIRYLIFCFICVIGITNTKNIVLAESYLEKDLEHEDSSEEYIDEEFLEEEFVEEKFNKGNIEGPIFSVSPGFYTEEINLTITSKDENSKILYTLDGSVPSESNPLAKKYDKPLIIGENAIRETNSSYFCGTVIRAVVVLDNGNTSDIYTNTYFIHPNIFEKYKLPIVSLTTEPVNLYDYEVGLFNHIEDRGREWEKPASFEFFTTDGTRVLAQSIGIRLHGGASRSFPFKSFRIYARKEYDTNNKFTYDFFSNSLITAITKNGTTENLTSFKRLILRNGGNEGDAWDSTMFRDVLIQSTMTNTNLDLQAFLPTIAFLNGEFYGIMNMIERQDEKYISARYDVPEENVAIYDFWYDENGVQQTELVSGKDEDLDFYHNIIAFIKNNDLSIEKNYLKVNEWMDLDNYIDYLIVQIYTGNTDWPGNNCRAWRTTNDYNRNAPYGLDGRIRWLLFDTDFGFGLYDSPVTKDSLSQALAVGIKDWPNQDGSTFLFRSLLKNEEFKRKFIIRFLDLVNTNFSEKEINDKINILTPLYNTSINEFKNRYYKMGDFEYNVERLRDYVSKRVNAARFMLNGYFKLGRFYNLNIRMQDVSGKQLKGGIQINSIFVNNDSLVIDNGIWSGVYYDGIATTLSAYPVEGYKFLHWMDGDNNIISTDAKYEINEVLAAFITVTLQPVFEKESSLPIIGYKNDNIQDINDNVEAVIASNEHTIVKRPYYEVIAILLLIIIVFCVVYYLISKKKKNN